jgi:LysM repeat protein
MFFMSVSYLLVTLRRTFKVYPSETRRYETTITVLPDLGLIRENAEACPTYELVGVNGKDVCTHLGGTTPATPVVTHSEPAPDATPQSYNTVTYSTPVPQATTEYTLPPATEYTPPVDAQYVPQAASATYVPVEQPANNGEVYVISKTVVEHNNITRSDNFDYSTSTLPDNVPTAYIERSVKPTPVSKDECNFSVSAGEHLIAKGENLYSIARRYGIAVNSLREWNGLTEDKVYPCTALKITGPAPIAVQPVVTTKSVDVPKNYAITAVKVTPKKVEAPKVIECEVEYSEGEHVVLQGENLYAIARKYSVTAAQLQTWNKMASDIIKPCQKLVVAAPKVTITTKSEETPKEYKIIAKPKVVVETPKEYKIIAKPKAVNTPVRATTITPKGVTHVGHVKQGSGLHVVEKGETVSGIAKQFSMTEAEFRKINFMEAKEGLSTGQVVRTKECACTIATDEDNGLSLKPIAVENTTPKGYNYVGSKSVKAADAKGSNRKYHVVQATETLFHIAKSYGKSVDEIRKLNRLAENDVIIPNQLIVLE